mmetsp:Transcript_71727/g.202868  ORF Transcript_71727/g.202868 Transcript_71727/m.202868 type:complete len:107 (-) Transcript_71727:993-1313(-)
MHTRPRIRPHHLPLPDLSFSIALHLRSFPSFRLTVVQEDLQGLKQEIEIMKEIDHRHVIRLYEYFQDPKEYFLVTELVLGLVPSFLRPSSAPRQRPMPTRASSAST